jgi:arabinogalactan oligomer / maltooligosaccharide transport system permease protein
MKLQGIVLKILALSLINGTSLWAALTLFSLENYGPMVILLVTTLALDFIYLSKRTKASKWLIPGTILLIVFQIYPVLYTAVTAFTNYSTGHSVTREEAIDGLIEQNTNQVEGGAQFQFKAIESGSRRALLLTNSADGTFAIGDEKSLTPVDIGEVPPGWTEISQERLRESDYQGWLTGLRIPIKDAQIIKVETFETAAEYKFVLRYDKTRDVMVDIDSGKVLKEQDGAFYYIDGTEMEPGWRIWVGFQNFTDVVTNDRIRGPFFRVLVWTFVYAILSVLTTFILGLLLATTLNTPRIRGQRVLRSILIIPYAIPGFLSILIWAGLLNDDFGMLNRALGTSIPWLFDAEWAKVSTLLVNLWLGFPYMFLITTGALQSIPSELAEAAEVDGATPRQAFTKIKLPLLLVTIAPLLIGSFAYNFNNFGGIYLLTGGGPAMNDSDTAGATDILISYTYKLAFASGQGAQYGLATAVSIIIFFIVASVSAFSFRRTRALENLN